MPEEPKSDSESWRTWRRTSHGLTWRVALPEDMPAICRVWKAKARIIGTKGRMPDPFSFPVVITLVAEDRRGRVVDGVFLEAVIDVTKMGANPEGFASLVTVERELAGFLKSRKFRRITAQMPERLAVRMQAGLVRSGFQQQQQLTLWDRWL